jgi:hypothetical protein
MATIAPQRVQLGYALHEDEGEAFWLLGMLQTIKISRDDTDGADPRPPPGPPPGH